MKKNSILNIITLFFTSLLLVMVLLAWYVSNQQVSASGITGKTEDDNFTLQLQRGVYDESSENKWTWIDTTSLSITNMQPNDVFFFRFVITTTNSGSLRVRLAGIESSIVDTLVKTSDDHKSVLIGNVKAYDIVSNAVDIKNGTTTVGRLFDYNQTTDELSLKDFKVQDTFKFYDYGIGSEHFYKSGTTYYTNSISEAPNAGVILDNITSTYTNLAANSVRYGYFALEFNDELSLKTYTHLDGSVKSDSNLYQAQSLQISNISVETVL